MFFNIIIRFYQPLTSALLFAKYFSFFPYAFSSTLFLTIPKFRFHLSSRSILFQLVHPILTKLFPRYPFVVVLWFYYLAAAAAAARRFVSILQHGLRRARTAECPNDSLPSWMRFDPLTSGSRAFLWSRGSSFADQSLTRCMSTILNVWQMFISANISVTIRQISFCIVKFKKKNVFLFCDVI